MFTTVTYAIKSSLNKIRNIRSIVFMCFYLKLFVNIENYFLSRVGKSFKLLPSGQFKGIKNGGIPHRSS